MTAIIRGTTDYGLDIDPMYDSRYSEGRVCSNCGEPIIDKARGRLCVACNNKKRSKVVQDAMHRWLRNVGRLRVKAWWENTLPPIRVVGVTLWTKAEREAWEAMERRMG